MASILDFERLSRRPAPRQTLKTSLAGGLIGEVQDEEHTFVDKYLRLADKLLAAPPPEAGKPQAERPKERKSNPRPRQRKAA